MKTAMGDRPVSDFAPPEGISFAYIDPKTGLRASPFGGPSLLECFRRGTEPQKVTVVAETSPPAEKSAAAGVSVGTVSLPGTVAHSEDDGF
jgi:membrane carboxypeptidase/penicillin-binding protein